MESKFPPVVAATALFSLGMVVCATSLGRAWVRTHTTDEMIRVVGSARRTIRSDFITWNCTLLHSAPTVKEAFVGLKADLHSTRAYLVRHGLKDSEMQDSGMAKEAITVKVLSDPRQKVTATNPAVWSDKITGYRLSQSLLISSHQVDLVDNLSRNATELMSQGLSLDSSSPMYLYTKMSELKVSMQAEAAQDAYARADQIAINSHAHLGAPRYCRMSTPSITPLYSTEQSDGGVDDTTSLDKKITAVVSAGYAIQ